ncbi:MAG: hypothetical protein JXR84_27865 [Anaerolineae bacterium]|nr:hypothetical protein [Anaerolineae bacterium]
MNYPEPQRPPHTATIRIIDRAAIEDRLLLPPGREATEATHREELD